MSRVAVVILNWNGKAHLERFLPSVVTTTVSEARIIVADNGSDDDSVSFVRTNYPEVEVILLDKNYGFAGGYNRALSLVDADYFILLNSDVETCAGWLEPLVSRLDSDSNIAAVAPKVRSVMKPDMFEYAGAGGGFIDILGYPFCRGRIISTVEKDAGQYDEARPVFWATGACMAVRAETFHLFGGFDDSFFAHMEEIDLCWRMQNSGYRIWVEPASVVYHLGGGTLPVGNERKTYLNFRNNLYMLYKNLPRRFVFPVLTARLILDGMAAMAFLFTGKVSLFKAVFKAHISFYNRTGELKLKRKVSGHIKESIPDTVYRGSVILRYIFGGKTFGRMM